MVSLSTLALLLFLPSASFFRALGASNAQYTLQTAVSPRHGARLRRYELQSVREAEQVLAHAEDNGWDVWHATPSHIDVYFPDETSPSHHHTPYPYHDISYPELSAASPPQSSSTLPWNLTSLENTTYHSSYHSLADIYAFMSELATTYRDNVEVVSLGHSGEGREMYALEISKSHDQNLRGGKGKQNDSVKQKPLGFVITGAQHAREWVATAAALYMAHALVANSSEPYSLSGLLDTFNFYIVPMPNPDGYLYTWEQDRFWYKNRLDLGPQAKCTGVDMNRNWGYKWKSSAVKGAKKEDTCSHWYPGRRPFQAPEVNNMANYFERLPAVDAFVDFRSYGQMLSTPYSYSCKKSPKDAEDQLEAASGASHAAKKIHGTAFTTGTLCSTLYRAPGNIVDWMYARRGVKYSFAAHLQDTGTYGFALPEKWIRPVGEETAEMVAYLAEFVASKQGRKRRN